MKVNVVNQVSVSLGMFTSFLQQRFYLIVISYFALYVW